jgi:hypothetical protein
MTGADDTDDEGLDPVAFYQAEYRAMRENIEQAEDLIAMHDNGSLRERLLDDLELQVDRAVALANRVEALQTVREQEADLAELESLGHQLRMEELSLGWEDLAAKLKAKLGEQGQ